MNIKVGDLVRMWNDDLFSCGKDTLTVEKIEIKAGKECQIWLSNSSWIEPEYLKVVGENTAYKPFKSSKPNDSVNQPFHYTYGEIETIDYIRDKLTPEQFEGYCMGNVIKYTSRYRHKGGAEDLKKADNYLNWAIEAMEG